MMLMAIAAVSLRLPVAMMILGMMIIGMILMDGTMITTMAAGDGTRIIGMKVRKDHADDDLVDEAMTLVGEWYGPVKYSYIQDDGMSRGYDEFYANMIFYQSGNQSDALSGSGVEIDEVHDNQGNVTDQQTLKFSGISITMAIST